MDLVSSGGRIAGSSLRFAASIRATIDDHDPTIDRTAQWRFPFQATDALSVQGPHLTDSGEVLGRARRIKLSQELSFTLNSITSGELTTQLSANAANLTAQASIADDDVATVIVINLDLVATEGRASDTASMSFALAGMPSGVVTLSFAGDSQCDVSPAVMTFDGTTYSAAQVLTITAIDDTVVEGSHSCQPTVTVASTDTRFNGVPVALAQITITDDLVDTIRTPLAAILQSDLERAVGQQSEHFSGIAQGALRRLQAGLDEARCGTLEAFDVDGSLEITEDGGNSTGVFGEEFYSCQTGIQHITDGSFSVSVAPDLGAQWMLNFSVQQERQTEGSDLRGWFWGGYLSRNDAGSAAQGRIDGIGLNGGIYGARAFSNGLFLDYYGAGALGYHGYNLTFSNPTAPIVADGAYRYAGVFAGLALSGQAHYDSFILTPRVGLNMAYAAAGDASVTATQLGFQDTGRIALQPVNGTQAFVETLFVFNGPGHGADDGHAGSETDESGRATGTIIEVAPRLFCARGFGSGRTECGFGGALRLRIADPNALVSYGVALDAERAGGISRASLELSRERRFMQGNGTISTGLNLDHSGRAQARFAIDTRF